MDTQSWFPLVLTGLISLQSKGLWRVFSSATIWKHQFLGSQPSRGISMLTLCAVWKGLSYLFQASVIRQGRYWGGGKFWSHIVLVLYYSIKITPKLTVLIEEYTFIAFHNFCWSEIQEWLERQFWLGSCSQMELQSMGGLTGAGESTSAEAQFHGSLVWWAGSWPEALTPVHKVFSMKLSFLTAR